ncbi:hypothetical protein L218DRAFT_937744 [Marasmius fiardii PR-910]|nr:hypothetical protein L218DRAFT_937744 [Marasmius fiardii PR-910]
MAQTPTLLHSGTVTDPVTASPVSAHGTILLNAERSPNVDDHKDVTIDDDDEDVEDPEEDDEDDDPPRLNLPEDVGRGIIKTTDGKQVLTILLVGETGVGKTSLLTFLGNVFAGHKSGQYVDMHEKSKEMGGSQSQSQTDSATLYEFVSQNGVVVRVLDTPGLADTRGLAVDERHKASIAKAIQDHVSVVNAVLILANGTLPRLGVATDYALSTLTAIFPRTLVDNIGFVFTNVPNALAWNFTQDALPSKLQHVGQFLIDNPVAVQRKYQELEAKKQPKRVLKTLLADVKEAERKAIEVVADLIDWVDQRPPQPTKDIITLYEQSQSIEKNMVNAFAQLQQAGEKKRELEELKKRLEKANSDVDASKNVEAVASKKRYVCERQVSQLRQACLVPGCFCNCQPASNSRPRGLKDKLSSFVGRAEDCSLCGHQIKQQQLSHWEWQEVGEDVRVTTHETQGMPEKANNVKGEKEASQVTLAETEINKATKEIEEAIARIASSVEAYSKLSLSGSFTNQIVKTIDLMKFNIEAMKGKGDSDAAEVQKLENSMASMKEKLRFLEAATKKTQEQGNFSSRFSYVSAKISEFSSSITFVGAKVTAFLGKR